MIRKPKFSICILFFAVVLAALIVWAVALQQRHQRNNAIERFRNTAENSRLTVCPTSLSEALGYENAHAILSDITTINPRFVVDDAGRFAQIHHQGFSDDKNYADAVVLTRIGSGASHYWYGPLGTRIDSISLTSIGVRVLIYGEFELAGNMQYVEITNPRTLFIPWRPGDEPSSGLFEGQLLKPDADG